MLNHVLLVGRLAGVPRQRAGRGELLVAAAVVVTTRERSNRGSGQRVVEQLRHTVVFFGNQANAALRLPDQAMVKVVGRLDYRPNGTEGPGQQGQAEIVAESVQLLDARPPAGAVDSEPPPAGDDPQ